MHSADKLPSLGCPHTANRSQISFINTPYVGGVPGNRYLLDFVHLVDVLSSELVISELGQRSNY